MICCPASCHGFPLPALPGTPGLQKHGLAILWLLIGCLFLSMVRVLDSAFLGNRYSRGRNADKAYSDGHSHPRNDDERAV